MTRVGVIGCGMVSHAYLGTIARAAELELVALSSRTMKSAERQAGRYGGRPMTVDCLLADRSIDVVVNLAPPSTRFDLGRRILESGHHFYCEKPFATSLGEAASLLDLAERNGLAIGCAPDTFLGDGHQTSRRLIDEGAIGRVVGGAVAFGTGGMEGWHPDPGFFYGKGGGPLLDIGPYYVTQLVNLLGSVVRVSALGTAPLPVRKVISATGAAVAIPVEVPTTVNGSLLFANGANVSVALSWDVRFHSRPPIELYGERGTLTAPDPNGFQGRNRMTNASGDQIDVGDYAPRPHLSDVSLARSVAALMAGTDPVTGGPAGPETSMRYGDLRGLGVVDMARALSVGDAPRASGRLAFHVLEVLLGLERACLEGRAVDIDSRTERPAPLAHLNPQPSIGRLNDGTEVYDA